MNSNNKFNPFGNNKNDADANKNNSKSEHIKGDFYNKLNDMLREALKNISDNSENLPEDLRKRMDDFSVQYASIVTMEKLIFESNNKDKKFMLDIISSYESIMFTFKITLDILMHRVHETHDNYNIASIEDALSCVTNAIGEDNKEGMNAFRFFIELMSYYALCVQYQISQLSIQDGVHFNIMKYSKERNKINNNNEDNSDE